MKQENDMLKTDVIAMRNDTQDMKATMASISTQIDTLNKGVIGNTRGASFVPLMMLLMGFVFGAGTILVYRQRSLKKS